MWAHNLVIAAAFMSVLLMQHPDFFSDLKNSLYSNFKDLSSFSMTITLALFGYVAFVIYRKFKRVVAAQKIAGTIGLRLHSTKSIGWLILEVRIRD